MADTFNVPKLGEVKKTYVYVGVAGVGGYVAWRWWQAGQAAAVDDTAAADPGDSMGTIGADVGSGTGGYYDPGSAASSTTVDTIATDAQWFQAAVDYLEGIGRDSSTASTALSRYLDGLALSSDQQDMVRIALGAVGTPPSGAKPLKEVTVTVPAAPGNLRANGNPTSSTVPLQWNAVAGATHYRIYRTDLGGEPIGDSLDTQFNAHGLTANHTYSFQVAALNSAGQTGAKSNTFTAKTGAAALKAPTGLKVRQAFSTAVQVQWNAVTGADGYQLQRAGGPTWESTDPADTVSGLKPNTSYKVRVRALQPGARTAATPWSGYLTIRTKR